MAHGGKIWRTLSENELIRLPVPKWNDLPTHARGDLRMAGFNENWVERMKRFSHEPPDKLWLTVLTLYVKMKGLGLWQFKFVRGDEEFPPQRKTEVGKLHFWCPNHRHFKALLRGRDDFTTPDASDAAWESREKRCEGSLHFKRFDEKDYKDKVRIQAHIDRFGTGPEASDWPSLKAAVGCTIAHLATYNGFKNVDALRALLLRQGWDAAALLGESATNGVLW